MARASSFESEKQIRSGNAAAKSVKSQDLKKEVCHESVGRVKKDNINFPPLLPV